MENHQGALTLQVRNYVRILICLLCRDPVPQTKERELCPVTDSAAPAWAVSPPLPPHPETVHLGNSARLGLATASSGPLPLWSRSLPDKQLVGHVTCVSSSSLSPPEDKAPSRGHGTALERLSPLFHLAPWPLLWPGSGGHDDGGNPFLWPPSATVGSPF